MRSIFSGNRTRRPASSVTSRVWSILGAGVREQLAQRSRASWSAAKIRSALAERTREGVLAGSLTECAAESPKHGRRFNQVETVPARSKSIFKVKIPSPLCRGRDRLSDGTVSGKKNFPLRPERLFAGIPKLRKHSGRSPGFASPGEAFTVARPRGILTRFPILLALMRGT